MMELKLTAAVASVIYYVLLHLLVYLIYKEKAPKLPAALFYNSVRVTVTAFAGAASVLLSSLLCEGTDIRIMILYYAGILLLSVTAVTDMEEKRIPNKVLVCAASVWAVYIAVNAFISPSAAAAIAGFSLSGALMGGLIFLLGYFFTRRKLGGGDVKLAAVLGLFFAYEKTFGVLLWGLIICCIFSAVMMLMKKIQKDTPVPLAPFLLAGSCIMMFIN